MYTVEQILNEKGGQVWTIGPDQTVYEALGLMAQHSLGALVVTENGQVIGMLSERDYARKIILLGRSSSSTQVREIMSAPVFTITADWDVERCMRAMTDRRVRHLPVVQDGALRGIISIGDIVKAIITSQQTVIDQLSQYMQIKMP